MQNAVPYFYQRGFIMNYAVIKKFDIANGPGVRVSLFVSGCRHHCKNCFNREAWDFNYGNKFDDGVIADIINSCEKPHIAGLSLLGGEPFEPENRDGILKLVKLFNKKYPEKTIWCYTGFEFEKQLLKDGDPRVFEILKELDVLVDGKFVEELKSPALLFRGSSNQRIIDVKNSLKLGATVLLDGVWERKMGSESIYD